MINSNTVFTLGGLVRQDPTTTTRAQILSPISHRTFSSRPSARIAGSRMPGLRTSVSYVKGINNIKAGVTYRTQFLTENDSFGIVDPTANAVCLNADGSPDTNPALTNPASCTGLATPNSAFTPLLACYDLTRTAPLPASDGCPNSTSGLYIYSGHADIRELALYIQDTITAKNWNFNLGLRGDIYDGISHAQARPNRASASPTTSSPPTPFCGFPMPAPWKLRSTRTWCCPASDATILWSMRS